MTERTTVTTIGETIVFKGELSGDEDLLIEGQVEGKIDLNQNALTVGEHGKVKAAVVAKTVVAAGKVRDSIIAAENVDIRDTSLVEGDIYTSRLAMAPGAYIRGRIIQQPQSGRPAATSAADSGVDVADKRRAQYAVRRESYGLPRNKGISPLIYTVSVRRVSSFAATHPPHGFRRLGPAGAARVLDGPASLVSSSSFRSWSPHGDRLRRGGSSATRRSRSA